MFVCKVEFEVAFCCHRDDWIPDIPLAEELFVEL